MKRILVACEESQAVCTAFRNKGFEAYSCDIIECSGGHPEWHIRQDVIPLLDGHCAFTTDDGQMHSIPDKWDLIIAHPPCTYLCSAGQPWTNIERYGEKALERLSKREEAIDFFLQFINADCDHIAVENPVGIMSKRYRKPDQYIQPYEFGHPTAKKTGLWLKGLPKLVPTEIVTPVTSYAWDNIRDENGKILAWNSDEIKKVRSKTFKGIAEAIADQWGGVI